MTHIGYELLSKWHWQSTHNRIRFYIYSKRQDNGNTHHLFLHLLEGDFSWSTTRSRSWLWRRWWSGWSCRRGLLLRLLLLLLLFRNARIGFQRKATASHTRIFIFDFVSTHREKLANVKRTKHKLVLPTAKIVTKNRVAIPN